MLNEVVVAAFISVVFVFGHTLSLFCTCIPHSIICPLTEACPVSFLSCRVFVADNMHPSLVVVVSETNSKERSGIVVGIDDDGEIIYVG